MKVVGAKQGTDNTVSKWLVNGVQYLVLINDRNAIVAIIDTIGDTTRIITAADSEFVVRANAIKQRHELDFVIPQSVKVVE